jgi:hypothetical protein
MKFTFDVSKCDKIFDKLLRIGKIKLSHTIPPIEDFKKCAYCKWYNYYSHAINEGQLCLKQIQVDKDMFPINVIDQKDANVLVRPKQAESTKGKNTRLLMARTY